MVFLIKKKLNGEYLGFQILEFFDKLIFKNDNVYDDRIIIDINEFESPEFECIVYELTLSNEVVIDNV